MNFVNFALILGGVLLNAIAQLFLKAGTNELGELGKIKGNFLEIIFKIIFEYHIFAGLTCYVLSVGIWIVALSKVPVSVAYPLLSIGYVLNAIAAWYLFGETLSMQKIIGITVIILGVYLLTKV